MFSNFLSQLEGIGGVMPIRTTFFCFVWHVNFTLLSEVHIKDWQLRHAPVLANVAPLFLQAAEAVCAEKLTSKIENPKHSL